MNNKHVVGILAVFATSFGVGTAQSARLPGSAGHQWPNPDCAVGSCGAGQNLSCFEHGFALMENRCSADIITGQSARLLVVPVPVENTTSQNHTLSARVKGNGSAETKCQTLAINASNSATGSTVGTTTSASLTTVAMGALTLASDIVLQVECWVAPTVPGNIRGGVLRVIVTPQ